MVEIIITTPRDELLAIDKIIPKPAYKDIPSYFKSMPNEVKRGPKKFPNLRTAKMCPSFIHIFKEGLIMYAHCDMYLRVEDDGSYYWEVPHDSGFTIEHHTDDQFANYFENSKVRQVFKVISPFELIVPKGYSLRQIPLLYDYNPDWHIAYGVYEADINQEVVLQLLYTSNENEIL